MKKYRRLVLLVFVIGLAFLVLFRNGRNAGTRKWDISNLEMENDSGYSEIISFEDAVRLKTKLTHCNDEFAEKELRDLESEIFKSTGSHVKYYQFVGAFTFPQIEELRGELTTLVVVVDHQTPYIYEIDQPFTEVSCTQSNVQWTQMNSSTNIGVDQTSVRLASTGYLTVSDGDASAPDRLSNTVYPVFTFLLENLQMEITVCESVRFAALTALVSVCWVFQHKILCQTWRWLLSEKDELIKSFYLS